MLKKQVAKDTKINKDALDAMIDIKLGNPQELQKQTKLVFVLKWDFLLHCILLPVEFKQRIIQQHLLT